MIRHLVTALRVTAVTVVLLGLVYPIAMTAGARILFPTQANGSLVEKNGAVIGSAIIGQLWTKPQYFHGRPSAAGKGYDPTQTGGTNLGPSSKKLIDATRATIAELKRENPNATLPIPIDLVTSSGSGIDPDISPEAASYQAPRIAAARHRSVSSVEALIAQFSQQRTLGVLGEPHVDVLAINMALDRNTYGTHP